MNERAASIRTNRLAHERSPYLRQHAQNPVDWYPWGEEAFARARAEQKPIFLSIGYSTCHWCHVMAHESFENESIAAALNRDFIPIKVDREERPDVDRLYLTYVQAATGQGGWPTSVWLTPALEPFFGGTYFPPDDRWGRPGFARLLGVLAQAWAQDRPKLEAEGTRVVGILRKAGPRSRDADGGESGEAATLAALGEARARALASLADAFDPEWGGFGGAPKFPRPVVLNLLLQQPPASEAFGRAVLTLRRMAEGGVRDQIGGGFHRYSVDAEWFVPHFEKMLYDQAQLAATYLEAARITGDPWLAEVAEDTLDYVRRDLAHPAGGFCSAEDADSLDPQGRDAEGAFYLWTQEEVGSVLGDAAPLFSARFGVENGGNIPAERDPQGEFRGQNHLRERVPIADLSRRFGLDPQEAARILADGRLRLQSIRSKRSRPGRDGKILTAWNGLMISALARSARAGGGKAPAALASAVAAAQFIRRELFDAATGVLYRSYCDGRSDIRGFADDYANLIQGLLDLYESDFDIQWLEWAEQLQAEMDRVFWDAEAGGYFHSRADDPTILVRMKEAYDGAEPAPDSTAASNLLRLGAMLSDRPGGDMGYRSRAIRCLAASRDQWARAPEAMPQLLVAAGMAAVAPRTVVLAGDPRSRDFRALAGVAQRQGGPGWSLLAADGGAGQRWLAARRPELAEMVAREGRATAYVCENFVCRQPVNDPESLGVALGARFPAPG